ncbi:hypothetical protein SteCoe_10532 [Stentor coeruleus]|uniref:C2H2-type domain-containing protein n=1 Tax=Stentor coeruleus TaxID=5963 RepID=A0A1R2CF89_9CILI|nr:hypothetical protein SteCoe_10532 [Stentor coeruleus]
MVKDQIKCDICEKEYANKSVLKQHMKTHLPSKPWKCDLCPREFSQKSKLIEHVNRHQGTPPFTCSNCGKGFYQKDRLKTHELSHSNSRPHECNICLLTFRRKYELNKHLKMHDTNIKEQLKKYVCETCGKKNYSFADLNRHMLKHTDIRLYKCDHCSKAFKDKYTLKCHEVIMHFPLKETF